MLRAFQHIAAQLQLQFAFGQRSDLNDIADNVINDGRHLLFYDGFPQFDFTELPNGGAQKEYPVSFLVLIPSELADTPERRMDHFEQAEATFKKIYVSLRLYGEFTTARAVPIVSLTDRSLDGLRITLTLKEDPESLC